MFWNKILLLAFVCGMLALANLAGDVSWAANKYFFEPETLRIAPGVNFEWHLMMENDVELCGYCFGIDAPLSGDTIFDPDTLTFDWTGTGADSGGFTIHDAMFAPSVDQFGGFASGLMCPPGLDPGTYIAVRIYGTIGDSTSLGVYGFSRDPSGYTDFTDEFGSTFDVPVDTGWIEISHPFIRGDVDADSFVTVSDGVFVLKYLYVSGTPTPPCMDAADANDNGEIAMSDAIYILKHLYDPGAPDPPFPFPGCGVDPSADGLACDSHVCFTGAGGPLYGGLMVAPYVVEDPGGSGFFQITGSTPDSTYGYEVHMDFDTSVLTVDSLAVSGCVGEGYPLSGMGVDSVEGRVNFYALDYLSLTAPFTDEPLLNVWYTASVDPSSGDLDLYECFYSHSSGCALIPELTDGSFVVSGQEELFIRGDANGDSLVDISDPLFLIHALFTGGPQPPCMDAADADDMADVSMNDVIHLLNFLSNPTSNPPPPLPYPACGIDPTPDGLTCDLHPCYTGGGPMHGGSMEAPYIIEYPGDSDSFRITGSSPNTILACQVYMEFDPTFVRIDSLTLDGCVGEGGSYSLTIDNVGGLFAYTNQDITIAPFTDEPLLNVYYTASPYSSTSDLDLTRCAYTIFINDSYYSLLPDLTDGTLHIPEESFFIFRTDTIPQLPMYGVPLYGCEYVSAQSSVTDTILEVCDTIMVHWIRPADIYCTWDTLHVVSVYTVDIDSIAGGKRDEDFNRCQCLWVDGIPWHVWACGHIGDVEEWWVILAKNEETGNFFIRGDANGDGAIQMNDSRFILEYLYVPGAPVPPCMDAADVNDDMQGIRMSDAIYLLQHLYVPGAPDPPAPFSYCGPDLTNDCLNCSDYEPCD